ncbi:MAG: LysE family transporter [Solirubrobacteraceae bacterium]
MAVAFGIGALVEDSLVAFNALRLLGGLYLIYLGARTFRARRSLAWTLRPPLPAASGR